jgi:hypothetical protein
VAIIHLIGPVQPEKTSWQGRPRSHPPFEQAVIALTYLRTNQTQAVIAEAHHTSQPTVSRIVSRLTALFAATLGTQTPAADDLDDRETLVIDGTLAPSWTWKAHPEDLNGKHRTTGRNLQVACSTAGRLRWVSDDLPGSVHDTKAFRLHHLDQRPTHAGFVADKGYIGLGLITPIRRQPGQQHLEPWQKQHNRETSQIRYVIERTISHLKNWTILKTDYRRPWHTHTETITAVTGLHFHQLTL